MFETLNNLTVFKKSWEDLTETEQKEFNPFLLNRLLSTDIDLIDIVNFVQKQNLPKEIQYKFWLGVLPDYRIYLKYPKKNLTIKDIAAYSHIGKYMHISKREAIEYFDLIDKSEWKNFFINLGYPEKEIKKLFK